MIKRRVTSDLTSTFSDKETEEIKKITQENLFKWLEGMCWRCDYKWNSLIQDKSDEGPEQESVWKETRAGGGEKKIEISQVRWQKRAMGPKASQPGEAGWGMAKNKNRKEPAALSTV